MESPHRVSIQALVAHFDERNRDAMSHQAHSLPLIPHQYIVQRGIDAGLDVA